MTSVATYKFTVRPCNHVKREGNLGKEILGKGIGERLALWSGDCSFRIIGGHIRKQGEIRRLLGIVS
jgi:hypothetical protein